MSGSSHHPPPGSTPGTEASREPVDGSGLPPGYRFQPDWEVTPGQVKSMLDSGDDFLLIDCRTAQEHGFARIEGACLLPLQELGDRIGELADHAGRKVVVHCHHGGRSLRMAAVLRQQGFADVTSMAGGIDWWAVAVDRATPRY